MERERRHARTLISKIAPQIDRSVRQFSFTFMLYICYFVSSGFLSCSLHCCCGLRTRRKLAAYWAAPKEPAIAGVVCDRRLRRLQAKRSSNRPKRWTANQSAKCWKIVGSRVESKTKIKSRGAGREQVCVCVCGYTRTPQLLLLLAATSE